MKKFHVLILGCLAILLTLSSSIVPGERTEHYADVLSCVPKCQVVAAGFPLPYIADFPGLSPTHSANLGDAMIGSDKFRFDAFCIDVGAYFFLCVVINDLWNRRKTSKLRI
jgi:hypothetical protein